MEFVWNYYGFMVYTGTQLTSEALTKIVLFIRYRPGSPVMIGLEPTNRYSASSCWSGKGLLQPSFPPTPSHSLTHAHIRHFAYGQLNIKNTNPALNCYLCPDNTNWVCNCVWYCHQSGDSTTHWLSWWLFSSVATWANCKSALSELKTYRL